jgi:MFS family permease
MMHAFGYGLFYASVGVLLLPQEALHMFEEQHAIFLAVMLALAGVSQLVSPAAGYYSDRCCHWMGRRMPYILTGNMVLFLCLGAMFLARTYLYGYLYLALLLAAVIALNVAYTGFTGLVSDVVPSTQMGFASGVMGALTAAGAVTGLVFLGWLGESRLQLAYGVYAAAVLACTPFTYFAVQDKPLAPDEAKSSSSAELLQSYWISPHSHGDFFWVFVSRTFYYMAVSVQIYILYYLRDTMTDPEIANNAQKYTAILCVISQGASGVVAALAGSMCNGVGRKPLIYFSCVAMALVYVGYCFVASYPAVIALGLCYGASNGIYLAVDYALAVECLPNKDDHAKDLALWSLLPLPTTLALQCALWKHAGLCACDDACAKPCH